MTGDKLLITLKKELDKEGIKLLYSEEVFPNNDKVYHIFVIDGDTEYQDKDNCLLRLIARYLNDYSLSNKSSTKSSVS